MKKIEKFAVVMIIMLIGGPVLFSSCQGEESVSPDYQKSATLSKTEKGNLDCSCLVNPAETISAEEEAMLKYMREEEKLARDVYLKLYEVYEMQVFNNISNSEQRHMDRVLCLLNHYNIEDPASDEAGVFSDNDLQELYTSLVELGTTSNVNALTVGATIEDVDIFDLEGSIGQTSNEAIINIFEHLKCGSENHMRAFSRLLNNYDVNYTPQYIAQAAYDEILAGENGPCGKNQGQGKGRKGGNGNGKGKGNGKGNCNRNN